MVFTSLSNIYVVGSANVFQKYFQAIANYFLLNDAPSSSRRSRLQMFFKIGVLKYFAIFTGKHLCWSLFSIMLPAFRPETFLKRDANATQVFSCEYCKNFKNNLRRLLLSFVDHFRCSD